MTACIRLLESQRSLYRRYPEFCDSLHPGRTVWLADLASDPAAPGDLGIAAWFNQALFRKRLAAAWAFLEGLSGDLPRRMPLVFFQSSDPEEDRVEYERRLAYDAFKAAFEHAPPQVCYLMTQTNFGPEMLGSWEQGDRVIKPLCSFSSWQWRGLYRERPEFEVKSASAIGYRVPDYPSLLGVSGDVATDYLARAVVHDLGHGWLPDVGQEGEPLHDALMVHAMGAAPFILYQSRWERLVHASCIDPAFFVRGARILQGVRSKSLTDGARFLRRDLIAYLKRTANSRKRKRVWQLSHFRTGTRARRIVLRVLDRLVQDGFTRYTC